MELSRRTFLGAATGAALLASPATARDDDPLGVRQDFPGAIDRTFLNTAYIGIIPRAVLEAGREWLDARARQTVRVQDMLAKVDETRRLFARMVGADQDEIGFLYSTTEGENVVVNGLEFQPGDNIVINDLVYPSTPVIYRRLEATRGVELRIVPHRNGATSVDDFARHVDGRTRLVSIAWVSNTSGYRHDIRGLADLAHAHGAYLYADAVQAVGMGPLDAHASGVDFFTTGTYKWLMAGFGVAPFFVRRELLDRIEPDRYGWQVAERRDGYEYEHHRTAKKFEHSSPAFGEIYQLAAALAYLDQVGLQRIETHTLSLVADLRRGLEAQGFRLFTPPENRSSILSFYIERTPEEARRVFDRADVVVSVQNGDRTDAYGRSGRPVNRVRVAVSLFNTAADIARLLEVVADLGTA